MSARFLELAELAERLAGTTKKLEKRALIAGLLGSLAEEDAALGAMYLAGSPFAETDRRALNVGGAQLSKALGELSGADGVAMHEAYRRHGDLGGAARDLLEGHAAKEATLTLADLSGELGAIAAAQGPAAKLPRVTALLGRATALEAKYLVKLMAGDMRIGVKQSLVEEAVAAAFGAEVAAVRHAVMLMGNLPEVVGLAAKGRLGEARMKLFHPLGFMLASPVDSVEEALERFAEEITAEHAGVSEALPAEDRVEKNFAEGAAGSGFAADPAVGVLDAETDRGSGLPADNGMGAGGGPEAVGSHPAKSIGANAGANAIPRDGEAAAAAGTAGKEPVERVIREAQMEDKYDGVRAQLHCGDVSQPGRVALFSRTREDMTQSFPELVEAFAGIGEPLILDGEVMAWSPEAGDGGGEAEGSEGAESAEGVESAWSAEHPESGFGGAGAEKGESVEGGGMTGVGRPLPFSSLQQRIGRKRVTAEMRRKTPVVFMAFDLLYAGGELLLERPLSERRQALEAVVAKLGAGTRVGSGGGPDGRGRDVSEQAGLFAAEAESEAGVADAGGFARLMLAPARALRSAEQLDRAYGEARARGNEGVMIKARNSIYQPGRRGLAWLKLKRELATLDVVVTAAEYGHGKRAAVLSDYTFAVRDGETLKNVGKAYSGLTDAEIAMLTALFLEHTVEDLGYVRTVEPVVVLEVAFNNVMRSERHASGFALRFPRILRIREDKPVEEIDTLERVEEIYNSQPDRPVE